MAGTDFSVSIEQHIFLWTKTVYGFLFGTSKKKTSFISISEGFYNWIENFLKGYIISNNSILI